MYFLWSSVYIYLVIDTLTQENMTKITGTIELNDTNWIDETRLVKWMYLNLSSDAEYDFEKRGSGLILNYKLSGQDLTDLLSYLNHL